MISIQNTCRKQINYIEPFKLKTSQSGDEMFCALQTPLMKYMYNVCFDQVALESTPHNILEDIWSRMREADATSDNNQTRAKRHVLRGMDDIPHDR